MVQLSERPAAQSSSRRGVGVSAGEKAGSSQSGEYRGHRAIDLACCMEIGCQCWRVSIGTCLALRGSDQLISRGHCVGNTFDIKLVRHALQLEICFIIKLKTLNQYCKEKCGFSFCICICTNLVNLHMIGDSLKLD